MFWLVPEAAARDFFVAIGGIRCPGLLHRFAGICRAALHRGGGSDGRLAGLFERFPENRVAILAVRTHTRIQRIKNFLLSPGNDAMLRVISQ